MVNNVEKGYEPEINNITNCTSSESSHGIEVTLQLVNVDVSQEEIPKCIANSKVNLKLSHDIKSVNIVHRFSENLKLSYKRETITNTSLTFCSEIEKLKKEESSDRLPGSEEKSSTMNA